MTRDEFLQKMLEKGKVTQAQIDKIKAKAVALEEYKTKGALLTKAQMQTILDAVVGVKVEQIKTT